MSTHKQNKTPSDDNNHGDHDCPQKRRPQLAAIATSLIIALIALAFPIPSLLIYTLITIITKSNSRPIKYLGYFIVANSTITMSILLGSRDYGTGQSVGFGSDMIHYADAFDYISSQQWSNWQDLLAGAVFRTGGGEPLFWMTVYAISLLTSDPKIIHIGLSIISFSLIFLAAEYYNRHGALMLSMYFSTITCYAFQGSALRSGLAFSMLILSISFALKMKHLTSSALSLAASATHFSMLPFFGGMTASNHLKFDSRHFGKLSITIGIVFLVFLVSLELGSLEILQSKIEARLSDNTTDETSSYQFLIELTTMAALCYFNRNKINKKTKHLFLLFAAIELIFFLIFPSIFPRLYRYIYAIYLFIFLDLSSSLKTFGRTSIICTSITWGLFIVATRYYDLFQGSNILNHFTAPWVF